MAEPETNDLPAEMMAIVTMGNGGYEMLEYRRVPVPELGDGEVLIKVLAAGVNNTEINTRLGWYSSSVTQDTSAIARQQQENSAQKVDGGWNEATPFPLIQGTDCCGRVVRLGKNTDDRLLNKRVLVRACMRPNGYEGFDNLWMASDFDGAFAEYVKVPATEVFAIETLWTDTELATIPCAYGTSENMLHRAAVLSGETVLVTGASGGVGSATVQLARRRGATVIAISSPSKASQLIELGCEQVIERGADLTEVVGQNSVDVVVDNVAGTGFPQLLKILKRGGRYVTSGAIAGPIVELDMRDLYLKDIRLIGCTAWNEPVFPNLISYIENNEIRPVVAKVFPLREIVAAQREFMKKEHFGNFVLIPPNAET